MPACNRCGANRKQVSMWHQIAGRPGWPTVCCSDDTLAAERARHNQSQAARRVAKKRAMVDHSGLPHATNPPRR